MCKEYSKNKEKLMRHQENKELRLFYGESYKGLPVMFEKGALIESYLERTYQVMNKSIGQYSKIFAFRVDLRLPFWMELLPNSNNNVIESFLASFKAKIEVNRTQARLNGSRNNTVVRYTWVREFGRNGKPHYHFMFFLNGNAYCAMGQVKSMKSNLYSRLREAWASALGIAAIEAVGLVHKSRSFILNQSSRTFNHDHGEAFKVATYLCKAYSKYYRDGLHGFGSSKK